MDLVKLPLKARTQQAKAEAKAKIFLDVCHFFLHFLLLRPLSLNVNRPLVSYSSDIKVLLPYSPSIVTSK